MNTAIETKPKTMASRPTATRAQSWVIDTNASKVEFTFKHFGLNLNGSFGGLKGSIFFNSANLSGSKFSVSIDVNTLSTGIQMRNKNLMHTRFFDENKFRQIIFRSDSITRNGNGYKASGILIMKGNWRHKSIPFAFKQKESAGIFKSEFTLNRVDYDIGGNSPIMGSTITVRLEVVVKSKYFPLSM
jgi:polyisoprenoid-binding protein YceI